MNELFNNITAWQEKVDSIVKSMIMAGKSRFYRKGVAACIQATRSLSIPRPQVSKSTNTAHEFVLESG